MEACLLQPLQIKIARSTFQEPRRVDDLGFNKPQSRWIPSMTESLLSFKTYKLSLESSQINDWTKKLSHTKQQRNVLKCDSVFVRKPSRWKSFSSDSWCSCSVSHFIQSLLFSYLGSKTKKKTVKIFGWRFRPGMFSTLTLEFSTSMNKSPTAVTLREHRKVYCRSKGLNESRREHKFKYWHLKMEEHF